MKKKNRKALKALGNFFLKLAPLILAVAELIKALKD